MIKEHEIIMKQTDKIFQIFDASEGRIRPHFILTGPSGSGKSHTIKALAQHHELEYVEVNAAQLTKEGISGNSLSKALGALKDKQGLPTICFVDEFDKLFISGNSNSEHAHESTNGVQNEFLKVLESDSTAVFGDYGKYVEISIEKVLFVFAGAFNGQTNISIDTLREFGIKTEFLGRVGLVFNLENLSLNSLYAILDNSDLLKRYLKLFPTVKRDTVIEHVRGILKETYNKNTLGIRTINTLLHQYFINGGNVSKKEAAQVTFQKTLEL